jgi:hypothetical protein
MEILPISFSTEHKNMFSHLYMIVNKEYLAIPSRCEKIITSLRTADANEYSLDKEKLVMMIC